MMAVVKDVVPATLFHVVPSYAVWWWKWAWREIKVESFDSGVKGFWPTVYLNTFSVKGSHLSGLYEKETVSLFQRYVTTL